MNILKRSLFLSNSFFRRNWQLSPLLPTSPGSSWKLDNDSWYAPQQPQRSLVQHTYNTAYVFERLPGPQNSHVFINITQDIKCTFMLHDSYPIIWTVLLICSFLRLTCLLGFLFLVSKLRPSFTKHLAADTDFPHRVWAIIPELCDADVISELVPSAVYNYWHFSNSEVRNLGIKSTNKAPNALTVSIYQTMHWFSYISLIFLTHFLGRNFPWVIVSQQTEEHLTCSYEEWE